MSKADKLKREGSVLEGHSPVNRYELLCVERMARGQTGPDEEKMLVAFQALDALVPNLGVYTRIFKKLRDDLYDAVYSDDLTTTQDGSLTKIPYFIHITRRVNTQSEKMDEMEDQLETVKKRLFEKHKQLEESQRENVEMKQGTDDLNEIIEDLKHKLEDKAMEIERLEKELSDERNDREKEKEILHGDINDLHAAIADNKEEIIFLSKYKKGYDDLYYAFLDQPDDEETPRKKKPVVSTKRANIMTNVQLAKKLEEQIMTVLNTAVEEFDKFMEDHKDELQGIEMKEDITDAELEAQEIDIDNADQQLEAVQERFKNTIGDISNELLLLKQHSTMLMEQLQILEENHPTIMRKGDKLKVVDPSISKSGDILLSKQQQRRVKQIQEESIKIQEVFVQSPYLNIKDESWKELQDSILSAGLGDDDDEDDSDPFIPQERVFSKYAAMVYTSNNQGKSFEEFKDAKYCPSCGEKTVICPHKLPGSERVFPIPFNCTHIKISRPKVKINKELMRELMKAQEEEEVSFDFPSGMGHKLDVSREHSLRGAPGSMMSPDSSRDGTSISGSETHMRHSLMSVFDDYKQRTNLERNIPRHLPMERCLSLIEQFWTYVIWQDDNGREEDIHNSIMDKLYLCMEERYMVKDITYLCNYDFMSAVIEYSDQDKMIHLFAHILVGNLEGTCFRYMMVLCDFISAIEWREVEDFRAFAAVVYPFLGEDDLETLQMSYTSFSENKISKTMVAHFIIHLILKYREPRFQDMENRLMPFQSSDGKQPSMTEREFKEALDNILPVTNDKLRRRLFFEAEKMMRREGITNNVPIMRLAQIASYLGLLHITHVVRDTINQKIRDWRDRPSSSGSARVPQDHESQILHDEDELITMSGVKVLSNNISRRIKIRQDRYDMNEETSDW